MLEIRSFNIISLNDKLKFWLLCQICCTNKYSLQYASLMANDHPPSNWFNHMTTSDRPSRKTLHTQLLRFQSLRVHWLRIAEKEFDSFILLLPEVEDDTNFLHHLNPVFKPRVTLLLTIKMGQTEIRALSWMEDWDNMETQFAVVHAFIVKPRHSLFNPQFFAGYFGSRLDIRKVFGTILTCWRDLLKSLNAAVTYTSFMPLFVFSNLFKFLVTWIVKCAFQVVGYIQSEYDLS